MKAMKKLIPAICMLLVSTVLLGTGTYAWFSMNTEVKADGMTVQAQSNSVYLQIVNSTDTFGNTAQTSASATSGSGTLQPVALVKSFDSTQTEISKQITKYDTGDNNGLTYTWVKNNSSDPSLSTAANNYQEVKNGLTSADPNYVLLNTFKIRVNSEYLKDATTLSGNLQVTSVSVTNVTADSKTNNLTKAVSVFVVCSETVSGASSATEKAAQLWKSTTSNETTTWTAANTLSNGLSAGAMVKGTEYEIAVYVFFDGENEVTTTNNAISDAGYTVTVTFKYVESTGA